jgi:DNA-binding NtrC family response regulator
MNLDWRIVVASSDSERLRNLRGALTRQDIEPICSSTVAQCRQVLAKEKVGLVFCDRNLSDGDYRDLLVAAACRSTKGKVKVVLMSPSTDAEDYQNAKHSGVFEVIDARCRPADLEWMVIQARRDEVKQPVAFHATSA